MIPALVLGGGILNLILGLVVLLNSPKDSAARHFTVVCFATATLILFDTLFRFFPVLLILKNAFAVAAFLPMLVLLWVIEFLGHKIKTSARVLLVLPAVFFFIATYVDGWVIREIHTLLQFGYKGELGPLFMPYAVTIFVYIAITAALLYKRMQQVSGQASMQLKFIMFGIVSYATLAIFFSLILPVGFQIYDFTLLDAPSSVLFVAFASYAILKYKLFNLKVIIAEILTFVLWALVLLNIFLASDIPSVALGILLLIGVTFVGYALIRGVINEIAAREKMQGLIQKIALANKRLVQLEQQKSEFVSIASHQLRTPLTAIKGYASMAIEGSFGKLESVVLEPLNTIFAASQKLVALVEDLLTVSRIEQGRIKYDWAMVDIKGVMEDAIKDNKDDITERRLSVSVRTEKDGMQYLVWADRQRLKQVFNNIIDNAVKFTPKGFVRVLVSKDESRNWVRVAISDTGIGMDKKALEALFVDPQKRAQMADKGDRAAVVGIGIYIAQQIVKTHKGRIWADSDGVNRGSTFFVELPAYEKGKSEAATAQ